MGLRDRALIGLLVYTFARVGAAVQLKVEDVDVQGRRYWVRLHEKGGKKHTLPCHHHLQECLLDYIEKAGLKTQRQSPLFRTAAGRTGSLTGQAMDQSAVWYMIRRRATAAGIETKIGRHTFRATGIRAYLKNGGRLEVAQQMAAPLSQKDLVDHILRTHISSRAAKFRDCPNLSQKVVSVHLTLHLSCCQSKRFSMTWLMT